MTARNQDLDALRGMAALFVVFFHMCMGRIDFNIGCTGVDLFFMISGFVMCMSMNKGYGSGEFLKNRFLRLYPTYWFCVSFTLLLILVNTSFEHVRQLMPLYLINLTMFQYYFKIDNLDPPYWTLTIELVFYFYILVLIYFKKQHLRRSVGMVVLIGIALFMVLDHLFPDNYLLHKILVAIPLIKYFPLFYGGMLFYDLKTTERSRVITISIAIAFCLQVALFHKYYNNRNFIPIGPYILMLSFYFLLFFRLCTGGLPKFITNTVSIQAGKISYPLYLTHQYLMLGILLPFFEKQLGLHMFLSMSLTLVILWMLAWLITHYVEEPSMKYFRQLLHPKTSVRTKP